MVKRVLAVAVMVAVFALLAGAPAFAEGYNKGPDMSAQGYAYSASYGLSAGLYTRATGYFSGPHGGYTTSTNKCQDCHSTHYALGSFMLLRANSREAACDFCHGGGGGSTVNIQMDNDYRAGTYSMTQSSAVATTTMGYGTGHTLGYRGLAPADIQPAFSATAGFACFDCHTPHGNSARTIQSFGSPSRPAGDGDVADLYGVPFTFPMMYQLQEQMNLRWDGGALFQLPSGPSGVGYEIPYDFRTINLGDINPAMEGYTPFIKWMGADTEISAVINDPANIALNTGLLPMGPLTFDPMDPDTWDDSELNVTMANMMAWQMAGSPPMPDMSTAVPAWFAYELGVGNIVAQADGTYYVNAQAMADLMAGFPATLLTLMNSWNVYYGDDTLAGNVNTAFLNMGDYQLSGGAYQPIAYPELEVWHKPLFFKGRFLLIKNPDRGDDYANPLGPDMTVAAPGQVANAANGKKDPIDWEFPLGPAASWGPFFYTDGNERFPLQFPWAPTGVAMENEFCSSCHDGTAGLSTESALVHMPLSKTDVTPNYITAYSHDAAARGCARAQYLDPEDDNNFGPHCANCHTGGSGCQTCHSADGENWEAYGRGAYYTFNFAAKTYSNGDPIFREGVTSYEAPASMRSSAVVGLNGQCLDGGFSYPHRTLGANMLKDALYGVDFDGDPIAPGQTRMTQAELTAAGYPADYLADFFGSPAGETFDGATLAGAAAHNLDSVCIDCHGNATYWNGDDSDYYASFNSSNPLNPAQAWQVSGWSLLLKGLP